MSVTFNNAGLAGLKDFLHAVASKEAQVGIFADRDARSDGKSNATIGAQHEFGLVSEGSLMPERSFLRMPLQTKMVAPTKDLRTAIAAQDADAMLESLGRGGVEVVQEAFNTGGFGEWPSLHPMTVEAKGNDTILIDTGEMRGAVGHRVVSK